MNHFNQVAIEGRLTRDPESKSLPSGGFVLKFGIASNAAYKPKDSSEWKESVSYVNCVEFGKAAEYHFARLKKGSHVLVGGSLQEQRWQDQDGTKRSAMQIKVDTLRIMDKREQSESSQQPQSSGWDSMGEEVPDDEIPF